MAIERPLNERWRRLAWFVGLWVAGVVVFTLVGLGFRLLFGS